MTREIYDKNLKGIYYFFLCPKNKNLIFFPVKKYFAVGEMIVFCVVFCRSVIVLFLLAIVLPALALKTLDLKTIALFLKQKRVRKFTWLDPLQCEKKCVYNFQSVQFSLKIRVQYYVIRQQMK